MHNRIIRIVIVTAPMLLIGCGGPAHDSSLWDKIHQLQQEKNQLETRAEKLEAENQQLIEQCHALDSIDRTIRLSALDRLDHIEIGKHTRLTGENDDNRLDTLTIYLVPIDQTEDVVKAPGRAKVSLWQLDAAAKDHLLGEWTVSAEDLKTTWGHSLLGRYYRLKFDLPRPLQNHPEDLTVKVEFTDYLTGKTVKAQTVIAAP